MKWTMAPCPAISVVIPSFNAAETIGAQLASLAAQVDAPEFEVVVADNRSTDRTAEVAQSWSDYLDLRVVEASRGQGVNFARNDGVRAARAPVIVLLDADDRVDPGALSALHAPLDRADSIGVTGGRFATHDPSDFSLPIAQRYLPYAFGGLMAFRREVFDAIGGFDESFLGGHDEVDFCWRAQHAGWHVVAAPAAVLHRTERATDRGAFRQYHRYALTSVQLYAKHRHCDIRPARPRRVLRHALSTPCLLPRLLRSGSERTEAVKALGWATGRWRGILQFRSWGPY